MRDEVSHHAAKVVDTLCSSSVLEKAFQEGIPLRAELGKRYPTTVVSSGPAGNVGTLTRSSLYRESLPWHVHDRTCRSFFEQAPSPNLARGSL